MHSPPVLKDWGSLHCLLEQVLKTNETLYENEDFQYTADTTNQGIQGTEYNFGLEMRRDRAKFFFAAAAITGNTAFIELGIHELDQAIELLESGHLKATDPTITPLIMFERARAQRQSGGATLQEQTEHFSNAFDAAMSVRNFERAATIVAWQTVDVHKARNKDLEKEASQSLRTLIETVQEVDPSQKEKVNFPRPYGRGSKFGTVRKNFARAAAEITLSKNYQTGMADHQTICA